MRTEILDKRLQAVASMVRHGSRLADIGTDHAYLPTALVMQGVCPSAIASDVRQGPLESAKHTVETYQLEHLISLRLGNGLETIKPHEADDIVIAGMGGETIAAILEAAPWVRSAAYRLVLQPMTRAEDLHVYLWNSGFAIEQEKTLHDGNHDYMIMTACFTGEKREFSVAQTYIGALHPRRDATYLQHVVNRLRRQAEGIRSSGDVGQADYWQAVAEKIQAYIV